MRGGAERETILKFDLVLKYLLTEWLSLSLRSGPYCQTQACSDRFGFPANIREFIN
jgi:hypothetical protein